MKRFIAGSRWRKGLSFLSFFFCLGSLEAQEKLRLDDDLRQQSLLEMNKQYQEEKKQTLHSNLQKNTELINLLIKKLEEEQKKQEKADSSASPQVTKAENPSSKRKKPLSSKPKGKEGEKAEKGKGEGEEKLPKVHVFQGQYHTPYQGNPSYPSSKEQGQTTPALEWIGGIKHEKIEVPKKGEKKKQGRDGVFLNISFLRATTLQGGKYSVLQEAKAEPEPILFHVDAPSVLPNSVRASLVQCFIMGEASGNLQKEAIDVRLVSLACEDKAGRNLVYAKAHGYVADMSGQIGIQGKVKTKMDNLALRSLLFGMLEGASEKLSQSLTTQSVASGVIEKQIKAEDVGSSMLAEGIGEASENLLQVYNKLLAMTMPVIEIGAGREVDIIFSAPIEIHFYDHHIPHKPREIMFGAGVGGKNG